MKFIAVAALAVCCCAAAAATQPDPAVIAADNAFGLKLLKSLPADHRRQRGDLADQHRDGAADRLQRRQGPDPAGDGGGAAAERARRGSGQCGEPSLAGLAREPPARRIS